MKDKEVPKWIDDPPRPGTYRSIFKWGAPDKFKHPNDRFYALLQDRLGIEENAVRAKENTGNETVSCEIPTKLTKKQISFFEETVGTENVARDDYSRVKYASGKSAEELLSLRRGIVESAADIVVHPNCKEDVEQVVEYCAAERIPLYPFSGGSSVTFGVRCARGGIALAMGTHMNRVLDFNETNQTITVEPGILGPDLEAALNDAPARFGAKRRYTCGHFPQSFEFSTVGGWIAALGSGQQSSYYGDVYDLVLSQEYATPAGAIKTLDYPSTATGPKVGDMLKGSEGTFGVLTAATLKVFRFMPEARKPFAFVFPSWEAAVEASREIFQGEFGFPSMYRISDPEETEIGFRVYGIEGSVIDRMMTLRGFKPAKRCLCIGHTEGELGYSKNVKKKVTEVCRKFGGMYITGRPVKSWEHGRFSDPYMREDLNDQGIVVDTLESAVTWDNVHRLHQGVRTFIKQRPNTICMTHASHFYPQGTNLYFIFISRAGELEDFRKFQAGIIDAIEKHGGSLSHHHGVGRMMAPWMERHLGEKQMNVLRALKNHFDPQGIMNPGGTLGLD